MTRSRRSGRPSSSPRSTRPGWRIRLWSGSPLSTRGEVGPREPVRWLVEGVFAEGQPALIAGPEKSLKSSLALEMGLSMAAGFPVLGRFATPYPMTARVVYFSGEMARETMEAKARLMLDDPDGQFNLNDLYDNFAFCYGLPVLSDPTELRMLHAFLKRRGARAVFLDPLYLSRLGSGRRGAQAGNRHSMGPAFQAAADACLSAGATPIFVDHTLKHRPRRPLTLDDLAWAGPAEFARQWMLVNPRRPYDAATGTSRLYLRVGGSAGHSGLWEVDIVEGTLDGECDGRTWEVRKVERVDPAPAAADEPGGAGDAEAARVLEAVAALSAGGGSPPSFTQVRKRTGLATSKLKAAVGRLVDRGDLEEVPVRVAIGKGGRRPAKGLRLVPAADGRPRHETEG